jgi:hypothetical protein
MGHQGYPPEFKDEAGRVVAGFRATVLAKPKRRRQADQASTTFRVSLVAAELDAFATRRSL